MGSYTLSAKADTDLEHIARDSIERWGLDQAEKYILGLHGAFRRLADFPEMGRHVDDIRPGYCQMETASHRVFYRQTASGVLIVRVLHRRMDFSRHLWARAPEPRETKPLAYSPMRADRRTHDAVALCLIA